MRTTAGKHVFPNISENLTRSLLKIKSAMLQMAVPAITADQPVTEIQPDNEVQIPAADAIQAVPPVVTDIVPVQATSEPAADNLSTDHISNTTNNTNEITPPSVQPFPGANMSSLPGAA